MFANSYFEISSYFNPLPALDRYIHPYRYESNIRLHGQPLQVRWTERAQQQLERRDKPLAVEMQLYFSCVVKKRVLFPEQGSAEAVTLPAGLTLDFRAVEASSCDPLEFARAYPVRRELRSAAARRMHPRTLELDYTRERWSGSFIV